MIVKVHLAGRIRAISNSPQALRTMIEMIGTDRIVIDTDYDMVETRSRFGNHNPNDVPSGDID